MKASNLKIIQFHLLVTYSVTDITSFPDITISGRIIL